MMTFTSQISILLLLLLSATTLHSTNHSRLVRCNEKDRGILVSFKQGIIDRFDDLSTWSTETDCCAWTGVHCHNVTGRVTKLELLRFSLEGEMNLSLLLQLEFLNYLDLSWNEFDVISIHHNVTLLSNLHYLDLSFNYLHMDNLQWLSRLSSLKYLNLGGIDLHKETNWLQFQLVATMLPSLSELHLSQCNLSNISPSLQYVNLTSLVTLDLSDNNFNSGLPNWLFNLSSDISYVDISWNHIHGEMPSSLLNLPNLRYLDLSGNQLSGSIPDWIGQLEHLQHLHLSHNMLCGSNIPSILGNLSSLITLSIGSNDFSGAIYNTTFSKLSKLDELDLTNSTFAFYLDPEWIPPFQLSRLYLGNTNQGPNFPSWIYTQKSLKHLDLSSSGISLIDGDKFSRIVEGIGFSLDLSNNSLKGDISNVTLMVTDYLQGYYDPIIELFTKGHDYEYHAYMNRRTVDLSANNLSGEIPSELFEQLIQVQTLNLSYNHFMGTIPKTIGGMKNLESLDLSNNKLSGEIPQSMTLLNFIDYLNLSCNNFIGQIPTGTQLQSFDVSSYSGNPELCGAPLKKCTTEGEEEDPENRKHPEDGSDPLRESLYLGMGVGFAVGFWGICGSLLLIRKWRHTYYRFLDRVADKLYVTWMLNLSTC